MIVRKSALALLFLLGLLFAAAFWLLRTGFVETLLESSLEKKFQARVELEQLELSPFSFQVRFASLAIADKDNPMRNLVQTGPGELDVAVLPLLSRRLMIETMTLQDIALGSERLTSGALVVRGVPAVAEEAGAAAEKTDPGSSLEALSGQLPKLRLDKLTESLNVDALTDPERLGSVNSIREEKKQWLERIDGVNQRLERQSLVADSKALKQKINQVKVDNVRDVRQLKNALGQLKQLREDGRALQQQAKQLRMETEQDLKTIKMSASGLNQLVDQDIAALRRLSDIGSLDVAEIGKMIFGQTALEQFSQFLAYYRQARALMQGEPDQQTVVDTRLGGRDIHYPVTRPGQPRLLVQEALFSGGNQRDRFSGKLLGLNSSPAKYGRPTRLDMDYQKGENPWRVLGEFGGGDRDWLSMRGAGVSLKPVTLNSGRENGLPKRLTADKSDVEIQFGVAGDVLSGSMQILARQPRFEFEKQPARGQDQAQQQIQSLFNGLQALDLQVELAGTLSAPRLTVSSSLDEKISRALKELFGEKVKQAEKDIREAVNQAAERELQDAEQLLDDKIAGSGKQLRAIIEQPESVQALLDAKQDELEGQLKQQTDELKDKAGDQLKDSFKKQLKRFNF